MKHRIFPTSTNLHGYFSKQREVVLRIASGDEIIASTLDSRWHQVRQQQIECYDQLLTVERKVEDIGHALIGPVYVENAKAGQVLEVVIKEIELSHWGWSGCGGWTSPLNKALKVCEKPTEYLLWNINKDYGVATNQYGDTVTLSPFPGIIGLAPDEQGNHSTIPPRLTAGNLDCKDLTVGSRLFIPIAVDGALLSFGDGHAVQGHGEVGGVAIEAPLEKLHLGIVLHSDMKLTRPRAITPSGRITFGMDKSLDVAWLQALEDMLCWMQEEMPISRRRALSLCSLGADLHITQVANGVCGVHCIWNGSVEIESGWRKGHV
jgi:acetamidase/formamidase